MATVVDRIVDAIEAACRTVSGVHVLRGGVLPEAIPPAGLVNIVEPEPGEGEDLIGGEREFVAEVPVEIAVQEADEAIRAAALDALAIEVAAAILGSVDLELRVDHRRVHPIRDREDVPVTGASAIRSATLPVECHYRTGPNPMEDLG